MKEESQNHNHIKSFICGGFAGIIAKTLIAPFDRVKIHFQVRNPELISYSGRVSGVFQALHFIYSRGGTVGLFRGHSAMLIRIFPYAAVNFSSHEYFCSILYPKTKLSRATENVAPWRRVLAGALSGATAVTVTYPLDLLRTRLAYDLATYNTPISLNRYWQTICREFTSLLKEGKHFYGSPLRGMYQGYLATIYGIIPYSGVSFFAYEAMKRKFVDFNPNSSISDMPVLAKLIIGMISGAIAQTAAYPFDVIRRRTQVTQLAPHLIETHKNDKSAPHRMLKTIIRKHGAKGLFHGLSINYLKVAPATGISFVAYEFLREKVFNLPVKF